MSFGHPIVTDILDLSNHRLVKSPENCSFSSFLMFFFERKNVKVLLPINSIPHSTIAHNISTWDAFNALLMRQVDEVVVNAFCASHEAAV